MRLFLVHCGYYDPEIGDGIYEQHTNFFVVAEGPDQARAKSKALEIFRSKRMHVDGLQEIITVDGYNLRLEPVTQGSETQTVRSYHFRDLAPKPATP